MALSTESLVRPIPVALRDGGHRNVGAKRRDCHDLPETSPSKDLGDARAPDESPIELTSRDVELAGQPGRTDTVVAVVVLDKREATFA
jgi:hypothetical protein